ncbi:MAG: Glu/Leu/Phe/Val family dehydrogenase [Bacillota bacterium]
MSGYLARMAAEGFEEVVLVHDAEAGLKAAIAIHSTARGPALGGTRVWSYPNEEAAVDDAMCLARGMSYKSAAAELPLGGGKGVIMADPHHEKSEALLRAYGRFVEKMNGRFITAADMGIEERDLDCVRQETTYVVGGSKVGSPSPFTAYGVWKGMKACASEVFGTSSLSGLTVAVQGVGTVGAALCRHLAEEGARLIVTDLDGGKAAKMEELWDAKAIGHDQIYTQKCDIFAPCAAGGTVNAGNVELLQCKIVAGAANNILKEDRLGALLHNRGILYAPDFIINAGGIIFVEYSRQGGKNHDQIIPLIDRIEARLARLFKRAREEKLLPNQVAAAIAEENLQVKTDYSRSC